MKLMVRTLSTLTLLIVTSPCSADVITTLNPGNVGEQFQVLQSSNFGVNSGVDTLVLKFTDQKVVDSPQQFLVAINYSDWSSPPPLMRYSFGFFDSSNGLLHSTGVTSTFLSGAGAMEETVAVELSGISEIRFDYSADKSPNSPDVTQLSWRLQNRQQGGAFTAASAVPEPGSLGLLAVSGLYAFLRRKRS